MSTTQPDPIPAREQAFAEWLRAALLAAIPADGTAITRNDARLTVGDRGDAPRGMTTGDVLRGLMRLVDDGTIEWCGVEEPNSVRRRVPASVAARLRALSPSTLRTIASAGEQRLNDALFNARQRCYVAHTVPESAERVASLANAAALADAELRGYRAAVADLLGAVPA